MSPFAIYSKTGKGVQEASGKTNLLERADRALLSMIDGRASIADLRERFGKIPEGQFLGVVEKLEAEGFIRQVSAGKPKEPAPARSGSEGTAALDQSTDLDFTSLGAPSVSRPAPQVDLAARARAEAERRRRDEAAANQARIEAEAKARAQAEARARAEAEARTRAQADAKARAEAEARARLQAEAKARAERDAALKVAAGARARAEAEARARIDAEARVKAAREGAVRAALEAKARAEAELTAKLEAERKAREELERKLKEQAERLASESREARTETEGRVPSEVEELRQRLEEKRRAREGAERSAAGVGVRSDDTVQRMRREADDLRERLEEERHGRREAERQVREDADRRTQEETDRRERDDSARYAQGEAERREREEEDRKRKDEEEQALREAEEKAKREAEEREWKEQAERLRREQERVQREAEEEARRKEEERRAQEDEEKKKKFLETQTLFADLSAFSEKEVVARPDLPVPKPAAPVPEKKPAAAPAAAPAAPSVKQDTPVAHSDAGNEKIRSELKALAANKAREERRARRRGEHRSDRSKERRDAPAAGEAKPKVPAIDWKKVGDRSKRVARKSGEVMVRVGKQGARVARRSVQLTKRAYAAVQAYRRARAERAEEVAKQQAKARADARAAAAARGVPVPPVASERHRRPAKRGARAATGLAVLIVVAAGAVHVIPLETASYEKALSEATGRPVSIGAAHGWLITGPQIRFERVKIGDGISVGAVHASPDLPALLSGELSWGRVELEQAVIPEEYLGSLLFGAARGSTLKGVRIVARGATLEGPVKLPALDAEIVLGADGRVSTASVRGPNGLNAKLSRKGSSLALEANADKFAVPFVPRLELGLFTLTGTATPREVTVSAWDGVALGGVLSGSAHVRWTDGWSVEGTLKARAMEAGAFAPALVSEGRTEGQGTYSMRARDVSGLAANARIHGRFAVAKGVLAKIDLSRAVQTGGVQAVGRTPFLEMTGEGTYDRGAVLIRNARMVTGGALNADASLDVTPSGSLSGNVIAELSGRAQALRTLVKLSGTLQNPQIGNQ